MIGIRADANSNIAMGHIMRCLSVATQLKKMEEEVLFITSDLEIMELIEKSGFMGICLFNSYKEKEQEIPALYEIIERYQIRRVLVDSYEVTLEYLLALSLKCKVAYFDDLNAFRYPVDMIINYRYDADKKEYSLWNYKEDTKFLLGSKYIPLREQFINNPFQGRESIENIFLTTGGSDPHHMVKELLIALEKNEILSKICKKVVIGCFFEDKKWLNDYARNKPMIEIYQNVSEMAKLMNSCDLAISASGTTLAELCCCGVPTIAFSMADNQVLGVNAYAKDGLLLYAGDIRRHMKEVIERINEYIIALCKNDAMRINLATSAKQKIDGLGAIRIAKALME